MNLDCQKVDFQKEAVFQDFSEKNMDFMENW